MSPAPLLHPVGTTATSAAEALSARPQAWPTSKITANVMGKANFNLGIYELLRYFECFNGVMTSRTCDYCMLWDEGRAECDSPTSEHQRF